LTPKFVDSLCGLVLAGAEPGAKKSKHAATF
jgi:hypothetical protein